MARNQRAKRDLYQVIGVARDADAEAIRTAYRSLARRYHPDVNPGDAAAEERFKQVSEAYAVLSDAEKRRNYDEFGEVSLAAGFDADRARRASEAFGARFGQPQPGAFPGGEFAFGDLDEMLGRIFTRDGRPGGAARRGVDLEAELALSFLDAARGGEHSLSITRPGADGQPKRETLTVRIPPGVADGGRIRLAGRGAESPGGGPSGDLHLTLRVRPHRVFRRAGRNLHLKVAISIGEAVLGAGIEVPTLEGRATVTVPPGTDSGRKLRLAGKGIPDPKGGPPGDLLVTVQIRVPRDLDEATRKQFESLAHAGPEDLRKDLFE